MRRPMEMTSRSTESAPNPVVHTLQASDPGGLTRRWCGPEFFEVVEGPCLRCHQMHHYVGQIDQHPFGFPIALDAQGRDACGFRPLDQPVRHGLDLPGRVAGRDNHEIGEAGTIAQIDVLDVFALGVVEDRQSHVAKGDYVRKLLCAQEFEVVVGLDQTAVYSLWRRDSHPQVSASAESW